MQKGTAGQRARAPRMSNMWRLEVTGEPSLEALRGIDVMAQVDGVDHSLIFGAATSSPKETAYALLDGMVNGNRVSFNLVIDGLIYAFTGTVNSLGTVVTDGLITQLLGPGRVPADEGSWSAQAQGGGDDDDDDDRPGRKPAPRTSSKKPRARA